MTGQCCYTLVLLSVLSLLASSSAQTEIELFPNCDDSSPTIHSHDCVNITQALANVESNTTLVLQPGVHIVQDYFLVFNKTDLSIIGNSSDPADVVIECDYSYGLVFMEIQRFNLSGLTIRNCGLNGERTLNEVFSYVSNLTLLFYDQLNFSCALFLAQVEDLNVKDVVIHNNTGFGVVGLNIIGDSMFSNVNFTLNGPSTCQFKLSSQPGGAGGGMFLLYQDYTEVSGVNATSSTLLIERAFVHNNFNCRLDLFAVQHNKLSRSLEPRLIQANDFIGAAGITLALAQSSYSVNANITDCIFIHNFGSYHGSALEVDQFELTDNSHVLIQDTLFLENGNISEAAYVNSPLMHPNNTEPNPAGSLIVAFYLPVPSAYFQDAVSKIIEQGKSSTLVNNCTFRGNAATSGAGIQVFSFGPTVNGIQDSLNIENCSFWNNIAEYGSGIFITEISYSAFEPGLKVTIDSIMAIGNRRPVGVNAAIQSDATGVVDINFINVTLSGTNNFTSNSITAISVYSGILVVSGNTSLINNEGVFGGGLSLDTESYLVLAGNKTDLYFNGNRALVNGGGIYVNFDTIRTNDYDCFLFFDTVNVFCDVFHNCSQPNGRFHLTFINNTAQFGRAIYGSVFSTCPWNVNGSNVTYLAINDSISSVSPSVLPVIIDPPFNAHKGRAINTLAHTIRANSTNTTETLTPTLNENSTIHLYPGQAVHLPLGSLDQLEQAVPLTVFSQLLSESDAHSQLGGSNTFLLTGGSDNFTRVPFHVFAEENSTYDVVISSNEALVEFFITVVLSPCPGGFVFNNVSHACDCNVTTLDQVSCNGDGTISYRTDYWIGLDEEDHLIQRQCVFDYCKPDVSVFSFSEPDTQCDNHRSGVLCGECTRTTSRLIGSSACGECHDFLYLLIILLFAVMGILLFAYLAVFNVTITDGFLNSFIFYSNIIGVYLTFYVPAGDSDIGRARIVPEVIISFLNLNFGIPICFYPHATELVLAYTTFVFPIYLMVLLGLVTLGGCSSNHKVSHFFQKINVTHVFATLILLSYTSFIQTSFAALTFIQINSATHPVRWARDPNVFYDSVDHIILAVLSVLFLVLLLPVPLLLLFPRVIYRTPYLRNFKPLIDAFVAPFAPGKEFWVGFRMLFRILFFFLSVVLVDLKNTIALVTLSVLITLLAIFESRLAPFRNGARNFISRALLINMAVFSITSIASNANSSAEMPRIVRLLNLYLFLILFLLVNVHYILIRFECTRLPYEKAVDYLKGKVKQLIGKISSRSEMKRNKSNKSAKKVNLTTHASIDLTPRESNFEETEFIAYREALFEGEELSTSETPEARLAGNNTL